MAAITPSFVFDFESNMQKIIEQEYSRMAANLWWSQFMKVRPSASKQEIIGWLLSTARIESQGQGGNIAFEDIVSKYTTFVNQDAGAGLRLRKQQLEDNDGNGFDLASHWSSSIGAYMGYWPQKQLVTLIKNGHLTTGAGGAAYDSKAFFATDHPVNPFNTAAGTYANLMTGGTAQDISEAVTADAALANLGKAVAAIKTIKMPNGEDPRFLMPRVLVVPPKLQARATLLTSAKFLAQAATTGGGSSDVSQVISSFGFRPPVIADELAGFESDTTWFIGCEEMGTSQLGAFVYVDREPFKINYYTGEGGGTGVDAVLARARELEWQCHGRNVAGYGHPYLFFKVKAS